MQLDQISSNIHTCHGDEQSNGECLLSAISTIPRGLFCGFNRFCHDDKQSVRRTPNVANLNLIHLNSELLNTVGLNSK